MSAMYSVQKKQKNFNMHIFFSVFFFLFVVAVFVCF